MAAKPALLPLALAAVFVSSPRAFFDRCTLPPGARCGCRMGASFPMEIPVKDFLSNFLKPGSSPRFALGRVVATPGALALMHVTNSNPFVLLAKHVTGDWGEIDPEDVQTNEDAVAHGLRVLSAYRLPLQHAPEEGGSAAQSTPRLDVDDDRIWVITEADRSVTTLLLPEEY